MFNNFELEKQGLEFDIFNCLEELNTEEEFKHFK